MVTAESNAGEANGACGYKYNREVSCISGLIRPDWPNPSSFNSDVDDVHGTAGGIYLRGWTFNDNNMTKSTQVHVYLDGGVGSSTTSWAILADKSRTDVDAVHHAGQYHGFEHTITGVSPGSHTVYLYANDQYLNQSQFIGAYSVTVTGSAPKCSDFHVSELREGAFTVSAKVTAASGIKEVKYAIWTEKGGSDDLRWYQGYHTDNNNVWWSRVSFADHNDERGKYIIHLYAYSETSELTNPGITYEFKEAGPAITDVKVSDLSSSGYTVTCKVMDSLGVLRVQFPTWTLANGGDDLAANWETNTSARGTMSGNIATFRVNASAHNGETGSYRTHIYAYDTLGNKTSVAVPDVNVHDHVLRKSTKRASLTEDGTVAETCSICGEVSSLATISRIAEVSLSRTAFAYNGRVQKPAVSVKDGNGNEIDAENYTVSYSDASSSNAGKYSVSINFKGNYAGSKPLSYEIAKASNTLKVTSKTAKVSKSKKATTVKRSKVFVVSKAKGPITYKKLSGNKKIIVSPKNGNVKVKGGLKKKTYKVRVKVIAKGDVNYESGSKTVRFKLTIR